jgi:hypothetical protein
MFSIRDLIIEDDPDDREPADYGPKVAALPDPQARLIMDAIDTFTSRRVSWGGPYGDGTIVLERPTGKMHSTLRLTRYGADGRQVGDSDIIPELRRPSN